MATDKLLSKAIVCMLLAVGMFSCSEPDRELIASNPKDPIAEDNGNSSGNSGGADTTEETGAPMDFESISIKVGLSI